LSVACESEVGHTLTWASSRDHRSRLVAAPVAQWFGKGGLSKVVLNISVAWLSDEPIGRLSRDREMPRHEVC
jgi:predicted Co/Zn/Cd cation transporter (cation efflux family)